MSVYAAVLIFGLTIAKSFGDSHTAVVDVNSESDPFHELLHDALGTEAERGYFNHAEMDMVLNVTKNRFSEHKCVVDVSLSDVTKMSSQWDEDRVIQLARRIMFAIISSEDCPDYKDVTHGSLCHDELAKIFHDLRTHYHAEEHNTQCFNEHTIIGSENECLDSDEVNLIIFRHLYSGNCLYPTQESILDDFKEHLNVVGDIVTKPDFENLLSALNIAKNAEDDHGHEEEEGHDHEEEENHDHEEGEEEENGEHGLEEGEHEDDGHDHNEGEHADDDTERKKREIGEEEEGHAHISTCLEAQGFYDVFNVKKNITWAKFVEMSPAILQQLFTGACNGTEEHHEDEKVSSGSYTTAQKYGYGTLSVLLISLLALLGLLVIPIMGKFAYDAIMQFFVALGISSLFSDALLHILPFVLGIHLHEAEDEHGHDDHSSEEEESKEYIWKLSVVAAGVYFFFLLECFLRKWHAWRMVTNSDTPNDMGNDHRHDVADPTIGRHSHVHDTVETHKAKNESNTGDTISCLGITPVCLMILIGDILHNFGDGIAIGVSFSASITAGIGTSLAIFCHELPHEFGDFAIYLSHGASKVKAILLNLFAALCALIGLYIGISVAQDVAIRQWLLAIIAGMFLYISLVDVLHEVIEAVPRRSLWIFFVQNIGMVLGWVALLLIALYEEDLANII